LDLDTSLSVLAYARQPYPPYINDPAVAYGRIARLPFDMLVDPQLIVFTVLLVATIGIAYTSLTENVKVPKVGYSWYTLSTSKKALDSVRKSLLEGSRLFPNGHFKIRLFPFGTVTIVTDRKLLNELRNASDDVLDFEGGAARTVQPNYTMSKAVTEGGRHIPTIRTTLTRNLGFLFEDIVDEMKASFEDNLALTGNEWKTVPTYSTLMKVVCRTSNRVIVGLPYCRDPEYCNINVRFTIDCIETAKINWYPDFLHPIVGPLYSKVSGYKKRTLSILGPEIKRRSEMLDKYGTGWADKPNDFLTWVMEEETSGSLARDPEYLILRLLQVNFAAIHTSSMTFTHALYNLAIHPEYAEILREEAFAVIKREGGWTKAAMREMKKGDSFLKENARINALSLLSLVRLARKDFTFSNGLKIPKGNFVGTTLYTVHHSEDIYKDATEFKPWRFLDLKDEKPSDETNMQQYVATSAQFLSFGYGKHACPGRFFAANELKAMLCYVVMNYDIRLADGSTERPPNTYSGAAVRPNTSAKVMFRRRST